mgnify:CR=1 FL=1
MQGVHPPRPRGLHAARLLGVLQPLPRVGACRASRRGPCACVVPPHAAACLLTPRVQGVLTLVLGAVLLLWSHIIWLVLLLLSMWR